MMEQYGGYMWLLLGGYAVTAAITIALILFCCSRRFHSLIFRILDIINSRFNKRLEAFEDNLSVQCGILEAASDKILRSGRLMVSLFLLNMLRNCFWYGIPYIIFGKAVGITLIQTMAVTSLSVMLAAVIPTPAGIGSTEFVFITLYTDIVGSELAISSSLLYRFATFVFPFLIGAVIVIVRAVRRRGI
jgi:hypothetical protein